MKVVARCDLQGQPAQQTSSVLPGIMVLLKVCPVLLWEYLRPALLLGTVLNLGEQTCQPEASNSRPLPLVHLLPCSKTACRSARCLFFLPHHRRLFMFSFTHFSYRLHFRQSSVLDVIRVVVFFMLFTSRCHIKLSRLAIEVRLQCYLLNRCQRRPPQMS